jgi:hypothetical protein
LDIGFNNRGLSFQFLYENVLAIDSAINNLIETAGWGLRCLLIEGLVEIVGPRGGNNGLRAGWYGLR